MQLGNEGFELEVFKHELLQEIWPQLRATHKWIEHDSNWKRRENSHHLSSSCMTQKYLQRNAIAFQFAQQMLKGAFAAAAAAFYLISKVQNKNHITLHGN